MRTIALLFAAANVAWSQESVLEGTPVSRPLTPVLAPEEPSPLPKATEPEPVTPPPEVKEEVAPLRVVMPRSWSNYDLLLWWSKAQPMPNLVTVSTGPGSPVLGGADTRVL